MKNGGLNTIDRGIREDERGQAVLQGGTKERSKRGRWMFGGDGVNVTGRMGR